MARAGISVLSDTNGPDIIKHSDLMGAVRDALYQPFASFEKLAQIMHGLSLGTGSILAEGKRAQHNLQPRTAKCRAEGSYSAACFSPPLDYAEEGVGSIACSDGPDQTNMTSAEFREYWHQVKKESRYMGDSWAQNRLLCIFWKIRPKNSYSGKLTRTE